MGFKIFRNSNENRSIHDIIVDNERSKYYYNNGKRHRENGPAIIYYNGDVRWYLNGIKYSFEEWIEKTSLTDEEKIFLKLKYS